MPDDPHDQAEELLPWYASGQLDPTDRTRVEAHLVSCARCQRQLALERVLIDEFQMLSPQIDSGWTRLRQRIHGNRLTGSPLGGAMAEFWHFLTRPAVAAIAAAQIAFLVVAAMLVQSPNRPNYEALGAPQTAATANVIVRFSPDAREIDLRNALEESGASLVGGPTDGDAYLLHVPSSARAAALARLRADSHVTLAEPIDGPPQ